MRYTALGLPTHTHHTSCNEPLLNMLQAATASACGLVVAQLASEVTPACTLCRWIAPEVLAGSHYDRAADVYAFGVILWEILTWQVPWDDLGPWQVSAYRNCGIAVTINGC